MSSKNERVIIRDLSDLTLQLIFDAWSASMNVDSKQPIAWNNARHESVTTLVSVRNTRVFRTALTALTEPRTL